MDANIATFAQGQPGQCATPGLSGLQYSTYPYQVPNGQGALAAYYSASQPFLPQAWFGNVPGQMAQPIGGAIGGPLGNPQLGGWGGQLSNFLPSTAAAQGFPYLAQQMYGTFGPQGCAIPGSLAAWYGTPQQLTPQGWSGSFIGQLGQPIGYGASGVFGTPQIGGYVGAYGNQVSPPVPFAASSPGIQAAQQAGQVALQVAQQGAIQAAHYAAQAAQQIAQQGVMQAAQVAQQVGQQVALQAAQQVGQHAAQVAQQVAANCVAQQMYSPLNPPVVPWTTLQPWGNLYGQIPQPFGANFGGTPGYPQFGNPFGGLAGQWPLAFSPLAGMPQAPGGVWGVPAGGYPFIPQAIRPLNPFAGAPLSNPTQLVAPPRFSFA